MKPPKGAIKPRPAVAAMAPYSPPTAGRADKLRLDFNENTVGCSPHVVKALKDRLDAARLSVYPEYAEAKQSIAAYFHVQPDQFTFTNGTDEAIQVFVNPYVDEHLDGLVGAVGEGELIRLHVEVRGDGLLGFGVFRVDRQASGVEAVLQRLDDVRGAAYGVFVEIEAGIVPAAGGGGGVR